MATSNTGANSALPAEQQPPQGQWTAGMGTEPQSQGPERELVSSLPGTSQPTGRDANSGANTESNVRGRSRTRDLVRQFEQLETRSRGGSPVPTPRATQQSVPATPLPRTSPPPRPSTPTPPSPTRVRGPFQRAPRGQWADNSVGTNDTASAPSQAAEEIMAQLVQRPPWAPAQGVNQNATNWASNNDSSPALSASAAPPVPTRVRPSLTVNTNVTGMQPLPAPRSTVPAASTTPVPPSAATMALVAPQTRTPSRSAVALIQARVSLLSNIMTVIDSPTDHHIRQNRSYRVLNQLWQPLSQRMRHHGQLISVPGSVGSPRAPTDQSARTLIRYPDLADDPIEMRQRQRDTVGRRGRVSSSEPYETWRTGVSVAVEASIADERETAERNAELARMQAEDQLFQAEAGYWDQRLSEHALFDDEDDSSSSSSSSSGSSSGSDE